MQLTGYACVGRAPLIPESVNHVLLDDIIELATDDKQPLAVLLRKCLVLAHQLKNERLKAWANKELNGYDADDDPPPYRMLSIIAKGNFSGPLRTQLRNWEIPPALLEERHRDWATTCPLIHPVSTYEGLAKGDGEVSSPWDPNIVLYYQKRLSDRGYYLTSAWQDIPQNGIVGMLDTIRTRVLNMALELKSEVGETDEDLKQVGPKSQVAKKVDQTITNVIYGGNVNIATGQSSVTATTIQQQITAGDWQHLEKVLRSAGMSDPELNELSDAADKDGKTLGGSVMGWVKKNAPEALSGGVKIGATVGQTLLIEYLKQYFGIG